jgi:hypothetical protein
VDRDVLVYKSDNKERIQNFVGDFLKNYCLRNGKDQRSGLRRCEVVSAGSQTCSRASLVLAVSNLRILFVSCFAYLTEKVWRVDLLLSALCKQLYRQARGGFQ